MSIIAKNSGARVKLGTRTYKNIKQTMQFQMFQSIMIHNIIIYIRDLLIVLSEILSFLSYIKL